MVSKERKVLGRGFSVLLQSDSTVVPQNAENIVEVPVTHIHCNPNQPRTYFADDRLQELAESITVKGVIQPILLRPIENLPEQYEIVAGERRWRASKLAGFAKIPAIIRTIQNTDLLETSLIENIQRENLNAIEEAKAYRNLIREFGYTQETLARRIGKSRTTITNLMRLLHLPDEVQKEIVSGSLSVGHARALINLPEQEQASLVKSILQDKLTVRDVESKVSELTGKKKGKQKDEKISVTKTKENETIQENGHLSATQEALQNFYATKISIQNKEGKGTISIDYYDQEDFNRIYSLLLHRSEHEKN